MKILKVFLFITSLFLGTFYVTSCSQFCDEDEMVLCEDSGDNSRSVFGRRIGGGNGTSHGLSNSCGHKHGKNNSAH